MVLQISGFTTATPWVPLSNDSASNVANETANSGSLLNTYKGFISVRKSSAALTSGSYQEITTSSSAIYAFLRTSVSPAEKVVVVINFGASTGVTLDFQSAGITSESVNDRIFGTALSAITSGNAAAYSLDATALSAYAVRWLLIH